MTVQKNKQKEKITSNRAKEFVKTILGEVPLTVELYWLIRHRDKIINSRFSLKNLDKNIPDIVAYLENNRQKIKNPKNIFIFASLHYWIQHAALVGLTLSGLGHEVSLGYLPFHDWQNPINRFDQRRQRLYAQEILRKLSPFVNAFPLLAVHAGYKMLPLELQHKIEQVTRFDAQYTLQIEEIDINSPIYKMRLKRNMQAARCALAWLSTNKMDVVIVPNGTIQEFGVVYEVAKYLEIPVVSYEFGDQRKRIWIAQNAKVMRQETDQLWEAFKDKPLTRSEKRKIHGLFKARRKASIWKNFSRLWQAVPAKGVEQARKELGLDNRSVVLLATNVLGDSLTLGRDIFTHTMQGWIVRTLQYFVGKPNIQFIIRIHPGEVLTHGQSMVDVINHILPRLPENIHLIKPEEKINTYDLIAAANLGLVYTTTVGLEMAMSGVPVIVVGDTHYRNRGFTYDPKSWVRYYKTIGPILESPKEYRLSKRQINLAWAYAYRFFFDFPRSFPWHLHGLWKDYAECPISDVLSVSGKIKYGETFSYLMGKPLDWQKIRDGSK